MLYFRRLEAWARLRACCVFVVFSARSVRSGKRVLFARRTLRVDAPFLQTEGCGPVGFERYIYLAWAFEAILNTLEADVDTPLPPSLVSVFVFSGLMWGSAVFDRFCCALPPCLRPTPIDERSSANPSPTFRLLSHGVHKYIPATAVFEIVLNCLGYVGSAGEGHREGFGTVLLSAAAEEGAHLGREKDRALFVRQTPNGSLPLAARFLCHFLLRLVLAVKSVGRLCGRQGGLKSHV